MPVSPTPLPQQQDIYPQSQVKLCSLCRSPLSQDLDPTSFFPDSDVNDHLMLCRPCKERYLLPAIQQQPHDLPSYIDLDDEPHRLHAYPLHTENDDSPRAPTVESPALPPAQMIEIAPTVQLPTSTLPSDRPSPLKVAHEALISSPASKRTKLAITTSVTPDGLRSAISSTPSSSTRPRNSHLRHTPTPNPYVDITRVRMRSQVHHCLYPGATFQGTQKSGRNSYDVTVSIVVGRFIS
jgi:hypothetical protein